MLEGPDLADPGLASAPNPGITVFPQCGRFVIARGHAPPLLIRLVQPIHQPGGGMQRRPALHAVTRWPPRWFDALC
jgi:hypothetical protein